MSTPEDTPVDISLVAEDGDGDALAYLIVGEPSAGFLSGIAPELTYTPNADFFGEDGFTFVANDGVVDSAPATVTITVAAVNDAPVADAQPATTDEDTPVSITLTGFDADGDLFAYSIVAVPAHGGLTGTPPDLTYAPDPDYDGPDGFTFLVNDGQLDSAEATVSITVTAINDPPAANGQSVTATEDTALSVTLTGSDVDGDLLAYSVVIGPQHGTLTGTPPDLTYTPDADYNGPESFTFVANDGQVDSAEATISITVEAGNDAPVADGQSAATDEDTPLSITLTGSDVDGDGLTYVVIDSPGSGVLSGTAPDLTYTPNLDFNGLDGLTFKANDGSVDSAPATVTIAVAAVNDVPTVDDQSVTTDEGVAAAITLTGNDVDGDALSFVIATGPANGALSGLDPVAGDVTYTPDPGYVGPDSFTFVANDGTVDSAEATVLIVVNGIAPLNTVSWDLADQRWQDIADNAYDPAQVSSYLYPDGAVTVYYDGVAPTLTGNLIGFGLKPNFAYQVKLNGKPEYKFGPDGDDWANEQLGYAGRWWLSKVEQSTGLTVDAWNSDDTEYELWKGLGFTDGTYDYVFEGYLLFDYIVTDDTGWATKLLALDSSLHVLWKTTQRVPDPEDTMPTSHLAVAESASDWYDVSYPQSTVDIYAEWEPGRALPGTLVLPEGAYNFRMFLTEESFHDGPWATVMACDDVLFTVSRP